MALVPPWDTGIEADNKLKLTAVAKSGQSGRELDILFCKARVAACEGAGYTRCQAVLRGDLSPEDAYAHPNRAAIVGG